MRRVLASVLLLTLLAGCGLPGSGGSGRDSGGAGKNAAKGSASASTSTSTSPSATASASASPTAPSSAPSSATSGSGRVDAVLADRLTTRQRCRPSRSGGVLCDRDGTLRFQPGTVERLRVARAEAAELDQGGTSSWVVRLRLDGQGRRTLAALTKRAVGAGELIVLVPPGGTKVLVAAQVAQPITAGELQISGLLTRERAARIVTLITRSGR